MRRRPARLPGPRRRALRGGLDRAAPARAGSGRRGGLRPAAAVDQRRPPPGARRRPRPADTRAARAKPGSPRSTPRPPSASSRCTNAPAPTSAASTTGTNCATPSHGVEIVGYWGEARHHRRPGARPDRPHRRPRAGRRPVRRRRARLAHRVAARALHRRRRTAAATPISTPTRSPRICAPAPKPASRRASTSSATPRSPPSSTRWSGSSTSFGAPAVARCGHRLEHLEMVTAEQAARLGAWGVHRQHAAELRCAVGRRGRHVRAASRP